MCDDDEGTQRLKPSCCRPFTGFKMETRTGVQELRHEPEVLAQPAGVVPCREAMDLGPVSTVCKRDVESDKLRVHLTSQSTKNPLNDMMGTVELATSKIVQTRILGKALWLRREEQTCSSQGGEWRDGERPAAVVKGMSGRVERIVQACLGLRARIAGHYDQIPIPWSLVFSDQSGRSKEKEDWSRDNSFAAQLGFFGRALSSYVSTVPMYQKLK
ncbi:hypothetical protein BX600DRAFT_432447 [Xylariales sp. PMI_506]|nr:hypothetical protein BX600DRAFT_432447 [Xylariales sp. PMI_506]